MRLELATFPVKDVRFGKQTIYKDGVLAVNKEELLALALSDKKIASADLDVAFPNEQTRIVRVRDVVEPRVKVSGPGSIFPGILGPAETVGEGRTHRLSGVTVIASADYTPMLESGSGAQKSGLVDMWGLGAQWSPYGSTINIVLVLKLIEGVTELEAHATIQLAQLKVAQRLAEATRQMTPENVEVFELSPVDPSLPRVVYILGSQTTWEEPHSGIAYYGLPLRESLSTLIHPNELLDGALTTDARRGGSEEPMTWDWMNNPVVFELLREHGKRLNFLGIILQRTRFEDEFGKQVCAICASQMARLLGAEGAIITRTSPSGNNLMDVMFTVQSCEGKGIKTILATTEYGGADGTELPLLFYVPEATAMVTTGSLHRPIKLAAPTKVIGCEEGQLVVTRPFSPPINPWGELYLEMLLNITGSLDWLGHMNHTCKVG